MDIMGAPAVFHTLHRGKASLVLDLASADDRATLQSMGAVAAAALRHDTLPGWLPSWAEVELGFRVLGVVLGLRVAGRTVGVQAGASADASLALATDSTTAGEKN